MSVGLLKDRWPTWDGLMFYGLAFVLFCALGSAHGGVYRRPYKYYLDASRAEEVLAGIVLGPRLVDTEWLNILGDRRGQTYAVRRGDTLWSISGKEFGNPRLWRKLWQVNSYLTNPHELEVGQILRYYHEGDSLFSGAAPEDAVRIPLVKLMPGGIGKVFDLDQDGVFVRELKNRYRSSLIVVADKEILGEITGAYTEREYLGEQDEIWMTLTPSQALKVGDRFSVVRYERVLHDSSLRTRPVIGTLMRRVGEVTITGFGEKLVKGHLSAVASLVRRGDQIIALPETVRWASYFLPPSEIEATVLTGEEEQRKVFGQGEIVLLNKGKADGMKEGYLFRVYRDADLRTGRRNDVEPSYKGEVQVISTSEYASVGFILRNRDPIVPGDVLIPSQAFLNPAPPPQKEVQVIELN